MVQEDAGKPGNIMDGGWDEGEGNGDKDDVDDEFIHSRVNDDRKKTASDVEQRSVARDLSFTQECTEVQTARRSKIAKTVDRVVMERSEENGQE